MHMLVASPSVAGFTTSGGLAILHLCNEAESGSLSLRLMRSALGASTTGLLQAAARLPTWRTSNSHGNYLSSYTVCQAYPDAPEHTEYTEWENES